MIGSAVSEICRFGQLRNLKTVDAITVTAGTDKTKETAAVHWWQGKGGLLSLVDLPTGPPITFDTLVTGLVDTSLTL